MLPGERERHQLLLSLDVEQARQTSECIHSHTLTLAYSIVRHNSNNVSFFSAQHFGCLPAREVIVTTADEHDEGGDTQSVGSSKHQRQPPVTCQSNEECLAVSYSCVHPTIGLAAAASNYSSGSGSTRLVRIEHRMMTHRRPILYVGSIRELILSSKCLFCLFFFCFYFFSHFC